MPYFISVFSLVPLISASPSFLASLEAGGQYKQHLNLFDPVPVLREREGWLSLNHDVKLQRSSLIG